MLAAHDTPLALYVHVPWCVKKCPYCDFNSHTAGVAVDYMGYVDALLADARAQLALAQSRQVISVFFGGGTPSLLPVSELNRLLHGLGHIFEFADDCEITLEANPGTLEHAPFSDYLNAGINRLSLGVQTFSAEQLKTLGRIHGVAEAKHAITSAKAAGFHRVNVDLMHGLPKQTKADALTDLQTAIDCGATHISWYQLTIEPNTVFYRDTPTLPDEDILDDIQHAAEVLLKSSGFTQYEVSAWVSEVDEPCQHNLNYWQFGDYIGIGAGAHGKVTVCDALSVFEGFDDMQHIQKKDLVNGIYRYSKSRLPKDYLASPVKQIGFKRIANDALPFEFMMNALRLNTGVMSDLFPKRTGLKPDAIKKPLGELVKRGLLVENTHQHLKCTALGRRYLNQVLGVFDD